jgi:pimeloyl-ACP methyl ester carboxylesterase
MDDVRAVMDAVDSKRAALFGISEGGAMSVLFAATYPERTQALILYGTYAHFHTWVLPPDRFEPFLEKIEQSWGTGASLSAFAPTKVTDERFKQWWARFERLGASPTAAIMLMRMNSQIDVRHVLPAIRVPTLVLHRSGDTRVNVEGGRYLAANIQGQSTSSFQAAIMSCGPIAWTRLLMRSRSSSPARTRERAGSRARHGAVYRPRGLDEAGSGDGRPALARSP